MNVAHPMAKELQALGLLGICCSVGREDGESWVMAVTTHGDDTPQSSANADESLNRFTKCSPARLRGWSGQVQASEND